MKGFWGFISHTHALQPVGGSPPRILSHCLPSSIELWGSLPTYSEESTKIDHHWMRPRFPAAQHWRRQHLTLHDVTLCRESPTSRVWYLMIWCEAYANRNKAINIMHLNHPETSSPTPVHEKILHKTLACTQKFTDHCCALFGFPGDPNSKELPAVKGAWIRSWVEIPWKRDGYPLPAFAPWRI